MCRGVSAAFRPGQTVILRAEPPGRSFARDLRPQAGRFAACCFCKYTRFSPIPAAEDPNVRKTDRKFFRANLVRIEKSDYLCPRNGGLAQLARALAWHARGHEFESRILHKETLQTPRFAGFFVVCPESFAFVASLAAGHLPPFLPAGSFPAAVRRTEGYAACRFRTVPSDGRPGICPGIRCDVSEKSLSLLKKRRICKWTVARRESSG